jgi:hypothetical protein
LISWPLDLLYAIPAANPAPPMARAKNPARAGGHDDVAGFGNAEVPFPLLKITLDFRALVNLVGVTKSLVAREAIFTGSGG